MSGSFLISHSIILTSTLKANFVRYLSISVRHIIETIPTYFRFRHFIRSFRISLNQYWHFCKFRTFFLWHRPYITFKSFFLIYITYNYFNYFAAVLLTAILNKRLIIEGTNCSSRLESLRSYH